MDINTNIELPEEIVDLIIQFIKIECLIGNKKYNLNFYKKLNKKNYFFI